jgi:DNA-binding NarL/FixJ family response regulator
MSSDNTMLLSEAAHSISARTAPAVFDMITVSIVEDDAKLRETMARYLKAQPGLKCVGEFANAEAALAGLPEVQPAVLLLDINLPGMSGIESIPQFKRALPGIKIIMLTVFEEGDQVFKALSAGAFGYLVKSTRPAKIIEAIREVHGGGSPMSGNIARKVVQSFQAQAATAATRAETDTLSTRELEVLQALSKGHTYKQIAADLGISLGTVRTYIQRIYEKLHVHNNAEAVMKFARK